MKQKSRIVSKLFAALVILTLISCCFLGSTFARYTSTGTGKASVAVAKWDIQVKANGAEGSTLLDEDANFSADLETLSPSSAPYSGEGYDANSRRIKLTDKVLLAVIQNNSDVSAQVTFDLNNEGSIITKAGTSTDEAYSDEAIRNVIFINVYTATAQDASQATIYSGSPINLGKSKAIYVYVEVSWLSDDANTWGADADARDTWIGQNVTKISWDIDVTAVQSSELPGNN